MLSCEKINHQHVDGIKGIEHVLRLAASFSVIKMEHQLLTNVCEEATSKLSEKELRDLADEAGIPHKNLKRQMYILREIYNGLNNKEICPDKEAVFDDCMSSQGYCWDAAAEFKRNMEYIDDDSYVFGNTGEMFIYWWARRNADGTMELFHEGLETIYNAYFPE